MSFTNEFKDTYIAPHISRFTAAAIPELSAVSPEQAHWLGNFILRALTDPAMDGEDRSTQFNFLRRTEMAFREYEAARQMTMAHLDNPSPDAVGEYFIGIGRWEVFLSQAYQAWCLLSRELLVSGYRFFTKNDGSLVQRLNLLPID